MTPTPSNPSEGSGADGPGPAPMDPSDHPLTAWTPPAFANPPPVRIGRFAIVRQIGGGGSGYVYLAVQEEPRRQVAIKVIRSEATSERALRRFRDEAEALGRLNHPGIATIYEARIEGLGEEARPYIAMEYITGAKSLVQGADERRLTLRQRVELMIEVCDAVEHAHASGIVHRDLKPANILMTAEGRAKLIDFGVARAIDPQRVPVTMATEAGHLIGTPWYMSPEQTYGKSDQLTPASDVYSLGVVLCELLLRRLPYPVEGQAILEVFQTIRDAKPEPPRPGEPEMPAALWRVIAKALHKDKARRHRRAGELGDDLRRFLRGEPTSAKGDSLFYLARARLRRQAAASPRITALLAVLLAGAVSLLGLAATGLNDATGVALQKLIIEHGPSPGDVSSYERVRVVLNTDRTNIGALAKERGYVEEGLRRIDSDVLKRLAAARPLAVVMDLWFVQAKDNAALYQGIQACQQAGTPVVIGSGRWDLTETGIPVNLEENLATMTTWGGAIGGASEEKDWYVNLFVRKPGKYWMPSLAFAGLTAIASHGFRSKFDIEEDRTRNIVTLRFRPIIDRTPIVVEHNPEASPDPSVQRADPEKGFEEHDEEAMFGVAFPGAAEMDRATIDYADVLSASDEQLRAWFGGKAVLMSSVKGGEDTNLMPDGRTFGGVYVNASGLEALMRDHLFFDAEIWEHALAAFAFAGAGMLIGRSPTAAWAAAGLAGATLAAFGAVLLCLWGLGVLWSLPVLCTALWMGAASGICMFYEGRVGAAE